MAEKTGASSKLSATIKHLPRCRASDIPMKLRDKIKHDVNNLPLVKQMGWHLKNIQPQGALNRNLRRGTHNPYERVWFYFDISIPLPSQWWPTDDEAGTREMGLILQVISAIQNLKSIQDANLSVIEPGYMNRIGGEYRMPNSTTLAISFYYETPEQAAKEEEAKRVAQELNTKAFKKALADWFIDPEGLVAKMRAGYDKKIKGLKDEIKRLKGGK